MIIQLRAHVISRMFISVLAALVLLILFLPGYAFANSLAAGSIEQIGGISSASYSEVENGTTSLKDANAEGASAAGYVWPLRSAGSLSQGYTWNGSSGHGGIDIAMPAGSDVLASMSGTVKYVQHYNQRTNDSTSMLSYGNLVILYHPNGTTTYYAHMGDIAVSQGQQVSQGQVIGHVGLTGNTSGYHLHFELRTGATAAQSLSGQGTRQNPLNYVNSSNLYTGAPSNNNPVGWLDTAVGGDGTVTVSGWAFDPDNPNASIEVHIYVGGDSASGEGRNGIIANLQRDDVNKAYGISGKHGFKATFSTNKRGSVAVYAYGINVGAGSNARLDNSITTTVTYPPQGWLDGATGGKGTITVKGWALDRDYPTRNLEVQIYVGAPAPSGELHGGIIANVSSPDVTQTTGVQGNHRFSTTFRTNKTGNLTLYAYAVNPVSGQPNSLLLGAQTVNVSSPDSQTMYRLYNPWSGEHLFTSNKSEYDKLGKIGWKQEGEAWKSPTSGTKVYRLYNKYSGDHHYTTDANEYATLGRIGWTQEGVAFYSGGSRKVYRGFNPYAKVGTHHYTTDSNEIKTMVKNGWKDEGVGWYCS